MLAGAHSRSTAAHTLRPPPGPKSVVLDMSSPVSRATIAALCERVQEMLGVRDVHLVTCEVGALTDPDPVAVDALARMQLTARRAGGSIRLRHARARLRDLLAAIGLCEALPRCSDTVRAGRQVEQREQIGVDEEVDPADPSV
jgi:ABC-type transporter Mla MlaB component